MLQGEETVEIQSPLVLVGMVPWCEALPRAKSRNRFNCSTPSSLLAEPRLLNPFHLPAPKTN